MGTSAWADKRYIRNNDTQGNNVRHNTSHFKLHAAVLLQKLSFRQLKTKFPELNEAQIFIIAFKTVRHLPLLEPDESSPHLILIQRHF
jgi:hypothetical protein